MARRNYERYRNIPKLPKQKQQHLEDIKTFEIICNNKNNDCRKAVSSMILLRLANMQR